MSSRFAVFHVHLLGLGVVGVADDHEAIKGHQWVMGEEDARDQSQEALS